MLAKLRIYVTYLHCLYRKYFVVWDVNRVALVICECMVTIADVQSSNSIEYVVFEFRNESLRVAMSKKNLEERGTYC